MVRIESAYFYPNQRISCSSSQLAMVVSSVAVATGLVFLYLRAKHIAAPQGGLGNLSFLYGGGALIGASCIALMLYQRPGARPKISRGASKLPEGKAVKPKTQVNNLSFGLSSSDSEEFTQQILGFSGEVNGQRPFTRPKISRGASKLPEDEGEKPKTQVNRQRVSSHSLVKGGTPAPYQSAAKAHSTPAQPAQSYPLREVLGAPLTFHKGTSNYQGPFAMTTANLGMLPDNINRAQRLGHFVAGIFQTQKEHLLDGASKRVDRIAEKLMREGNKVPILCLQEVFDKHASMTLAQKLVKGGYSVVHQIGDGSSFVNSGFLFATRYRFKRETLRFWKFTNLEGADGYSSKGLLRILIEVEKQIVVIFITHLQAEINARKARRAQLEGILSIIQQDHKEDPKRLIYLAGDFNISDIEYDGSHQGEYTESRFFFSQFHDFMQTKYGNQSKKNASNKPKGTFYKMDGSDAAAEGCIYDRILLYAPNANPPKSAHSIKIRTLMAGMLSDHLPVTLSTPL